MLTHLQASARGSWGALSYRQGGGGQPQGPIQETLRGRKGGEEKSFTPCNTRLANRRRFILVPHSK